MKKIVREVFISFLVCYSLFMTVGGGRLMKKLWTTYVLGEGVKGIPNYPVVENKPLVVVIASYNNEKICEKNLESIFEQTYNNYRIIYIDDCSTDKTLEKVKECIAKHHMEGKVTLIHNETRQTKLPNLYRAYHSCQDDEIIVAIDGDDWLAHEHVLEFINQTYQNPDVWLTYGSAITHPQYKEISGKYIPQKVLKKGEIRKSKKFEISMLRTFYASLFKQIKLKDLLYQGKFYPNTDDIATMYPMIEMAREHVLYIPDVLYIINDNNPLRMRHIALSLEEALRKHILKKEPYPALGETFSPTKPYTLAAEEPIDLALLSSDNPLFLKAALESYAKNLHSLKRLAIFYEATTPEYSAAYEKLSIAFPEIRFVRECDTSYPALKEWLTKKEKRSSPYIALATDEMILTEPLDLLDGARRLESTGGIAILAGHTGQNLSLLDVDQKVRCMTLASAKKIPNLLIDQFIGIFRKEDVLKTLNNENLSHQSFLKTHYETIEAPEEVTLFYADHQAYCLESISSRINFSKETLLKKFEEGSKINLSSFTSHKREGIKETDIESPMQVVF